ncbi:MAG: DegV family protein [Eubacterium sp.]|nr:DegV family protein [Eubacterium sp.]MCM1213035.1 DegV family protein [Lachnospiraceae bacterium]MCM1304726.1 DegV family protein [Butyrivibrio sp.]MCM1344922.1 DegV family protein [Muribaculaceae bacterium]MCM1240792.1 DegV family protein [Lachnospiraceae bacterium]
MVKIITDSCSDIVDNKREDLLILPITITFDSKEYQDGIDLSHREFYEKLIESDELPATSQIPPSVFEEAYKAALEQGDEVIVITISSKLSGTYQSANIGAENHRESVYIVDSENASLGERILVEYALRLKDQGLSAKEIVKNLEKEKKNIRLIALLDTLEYLKKGGRISKAAAAAGSLLSIKPVIAIQGGEVVVLGKARGSKQGNNLLAEEIARANGVDYDMPFILAYTGLTDVVIQKYIDDHENLWKGIVDRPIPASVGGAIGTHIGPGAIGIAFFAVSE